MFIVETKHTHPDGTPGALKVHVDVPIAAQAAAEVLKRLSGPTRATTYHVAVTDTEGRLHYFHRAHTHNRASALFAIA